jgi:hypothetical protein
VAHIFSVICLESLGMHFLAKTPKNHGYMCFYLEGIASNATLMYYVKSKKLQETLT